jgi:putative zinc finger/helix-turn-helix YgiT family protein
MSTFYECDSCGIITRTTAQDKTSYRTIIAIRKRIDGLMSGDSIRIFLAKYYITQQKASELFGGGPNSFSKYINDDVAQSNSIDSLIKLAERMPKIILELADINNVSLPEKAVSALRNNSNQNENSPDVLPNDYSQVSRVLPKPRGFVPLDATTGVLGSTYSRMFNLFASEISRVREFAAVHINSSSVDNREITPIHVSISDSNNEIVREIPAGFVSMIHSKRDKKPIKLAKKHDE